MPLGRQSQTTEVWDHVRHAVDAGSRVRRVELDAYVDNVVQREFPEQGYPVRRPAVLRAWLAAYAAATSTTTAYSKILDAATAGLANKPAKESEGTILGAFFEHLAALSVHTYAAAADARVGHLRTRNNDHEVDLIVQHPDARVLGLEVKLADRVEDADDKHLHWLRKRIGTDLIDAIVIYAGEHAYRQRDGVAVIPLALLGP